MLSCSGMPGVGGGGAGLGALDFLRNNPQVCFCFQHPLLSMNRAAPLRLTLPSGADF